MDIARRPGETARAHRARIHYAMAGAERSVNATARDLALHRRTAQRWAQRWDWVATAREYDASLAAAAVASATAAYLAELHAHRQQSLTVGAELLDIARDLLTRTRTAIETTPLQPRDLAYAVRAIMVGLDLRAQALGIAQLQQQLQHHTRQP